MKPIVLVVTNSEGTSFDALGLQLKKSMPEFHVQVLPHNKIPHGTVCDVIVYLWWRPLAEGLQARVIVKKATVLAVFDHHSWTFSPMYAADMSKALRRADYLAVGNEILLDQLRAKYDAIPPAFICETGVDTQRFKLSAYPKDFTALWSGCSRAGENDLKGLNIIKRAAELAGVRLLIADTLGEQGDRVNYSDMPNWYSNGTVFMIGSRSEGTPRTLLEAMACGRLIVSTRVGVVPRLVQHGVNGVIVDRDPEAMAAGLRYLRNMLALVPPQIPKEAARRSAEAYDISHKIQTWKACVMTAASGKWWGASPMAKTPAQPVTQEKFSGRPAVEIAELQGQPLPFGECQRLINERDPGTPGRPLILLCSNYRFMSRTLFMIDPLMDRYRFVMDQGDPFPNADLVWTLYPFSDGHRALLCHQSQGIPLVMTMRGLALPDRRTMAPVVDLYNRATAITSLTQSLKNELVRMSPSLEQKICVIPNGGYVGSQAEFTGEIPYKRPLILSLTNFNFEGKRIAVDQIVNAFSRTSFGGSVLIGGREGRFAPAKGLINGHVRYLGFIKNRFAFMAAADVFLYHSHVDGQPSSLMEAMSMGLACVVGRSRNSGASEFIKDGVTGIIRSDPAAMVSEAIRLSRDKAEAKRLGDSARIYMRETLTWEASAHKYDAVFQSVLPAGKRRAI